MKTRDQIRAERANAAVSSVKADQVRDYAAEIRSFPVMVFEGGLGPTLASLKAKGGAAKLGLYEHVSLWVCETVFGDPKGNLLSLIIKNPASKLMRAHEESLAFVAWLRRFAEAREPKARKA